MDWYQTAWPETSDRSCWTLRFRSISNSLDKPGTIHGQRICDLVQVDQGKQEDDGHGVGNIRQKPPPLTLPC